MKVLTTPPTAFTWSGLIPQAAVGALLAIDLMLLIVKQPGLHRGLLGGAYLVLLLMMALRDVRTLRVPNRLVYPAIGLCALGSLSLGLGDATEAFMGGGAAFLVLLAIVLVGRGAMGLGDVKVGAVCGFVVGFHGLFPMLAMTFVAGALVAGLLLVLRVRKRKDAIAFAPFLVVATTLSIAMFDLYLWS